MGSGARVGRGKRNGDAAGRGRQSDEVERRGERVEMCAGRVRDLNRTANASNARPRQARDPPNFQHLFRFSFSASPPRPATSGAAPVARSSSSSSRSSSSSSNRRLAACRRRDVIAAHCSIIHEPLAWLVAARASLVALLAFLAWPCILCLDDGLANARALTV